jgi:hypothetical protein
MRNYESVDSYGYRDAEAASAAHRFAVNSKPSNGYTEASNNTPMAPPAGPQMVASVAIGVEPMEISMLPLMLDAVGARHRSLPPHTTAHSFAPA